MTLSEIKKAAQQLTEIEKGELISFLSEKSSEGEGFQLPQELLKELDRRIDGLNNGTIKTIPYANEMSEARTKYGI